MGAGCVPLPDNEILTAEFDALLASETPPVTCPFDAGVNVTLSVAVLPAAKMTPLERPEALNPAPEIDTLENVTAAVPVFVTVNACDALVPMFGLPKLNDAGVMESVPCAGVAGVVGAVDDEELDELLVFEPVEPVDVVDDVVVGVVVGVVAGGVDVVVDAETVSGAVVLVLELAAAVPQKTPVTTALGPLVVVTLIVTVTGDIPNQIDSVREAENAAAIENRIGAGIGDSNRLGTIPGVPVHRVDGHLMRFSVAVRLTSREKFAGLYRGGGRSFQLPCWWSAAHGESALGFWAHIQFN